MIADLDLRGTEPVLDLGCGDGTLTARIAASVLRGEGVEVDASKGMLALAQEQVTRNLRFLLLDVSAGLLRGIRCGLFQRHAALDRRSRGPAPEALA
jgi:SAM-dependent methyltransferase